MHQPEVLLRRGFDVDSLAETRRNAHLVLRESGISLKPATSFVLAINEGMTNAIIHGGGTGLLTLTRDDAVKVIAHVWDRGTAAPFDAPVRLPPSGTTGGRGLWIARSFADRLTVSTGSNGTTLALELFLPAG